MDARDWARLSRKATLRVAGLMSGTSADGIDAAVVDISARRVRVLAYRTYPYPASVRRQVLALCDPATSSVDAACRMNFLLGELFAQALLRLAREAGLALDSIDLIGSHGQTICHLPAAQPVTPPPPGGGWPEGPGEGVGRDPHPTLSRGERACGSTLQIGEPSVIAERTGITTVADFRPRDIAAGGQGAPLVPFADYVLFAHKRLSRVLCNIGGIANITYLPAGAGLGDVLAFDTGPGNMILDAMVRQITHGRRHFDRDGRLARQGQVHQPMLDELLSHPYLRRRPPKTAGREQFGEAYAQALLRRGRQRKVPPADLVATAAAFTAESIARGCRMFPGGMDELILCGGGARNPVLVEMLRRRLAPARVRIMDELGIDADAKEAVSFAILAAQTIRGRSSNVPSATGAARGVVLGKIVPGR